MANYQLGPVIGKIGGGGVEIVEQQFGKSGTVTLPDGWGRAWVIAQAYTDTGSDLEAFGHVFGWSVEAFLSSLHRVALLEAGGSLSFDVYSANPRDKEVVDLTMIRID